MFSANKFHKIFVITRYVYTRKKAKYRRYGQKIHLFRPFGEMYLHFGLHFAPRIFGHTMADKLDVIYV